MGFWIDVAIDRLDGRQPAFDNAGQEEGLSARARGRSSGNNRYRDK